MKRLAPFVALTLGLLGAGETAVAAPDVEEIADGDFLIDPPSLDAPGARTPRLRTDLYTDFTFASSPDMSALGETVIKGYARNYRLALGGSLKLQDLQLDLEVPYLQFTQAHFEETALVARPQDQMRASLGDVRFGATYRYAIPFYPPKMMVGAALRGQFPTHTTKFTFDAPGGQVSYTFPRFVHIEPALLFATAFGPFSFSADQGALLMPGADVTANGLTVSYPGLYFYSGHFMAGFYGGPFGITFDVNPVLQLNSVGGGNPLDQMHAIFLIPGVQVYLQSFKIDLAGRFGLGGGADKIGVITFSGSSSVMLRVTRSFDYDGIGLFGGGK